MPDDRESRRRSFLKSSALAAGALALPRFSIAQSGGSPNGKIGVAVVGAGGMGEYAVAAGGQREVRGHLRRGRPEGVQGLRGAPPGAALQGLPGDAGQAAQADRRGRDLHSRPHPFPHRDGGHGAGQARVRAEAARAQRLAGAARCGRRRGTTASSRRWATRATPSRACGASRSGWTPGSSATSRRSSPGRTGRIRPGSCRPRASRRPRAARRATWTGTCGRGPSPRASTPEPTCRSSGAGGGTTAAARWATSAATPSTPRSGRSTWARPPGSRRFATRLPATASSR